MAQLGRSYAAVPIILSAVPDPLALVTGTVAVTQDDQTSTASGTHSVTGTVAVTQDDQTSTASGQFGNDVTGTVAVTQDDQTSTASGSSVTGTSAQTQDDQTSTASGSSVTGTSAQTQDAQTSSATGSFGSNILDDDFPGSSIDSTKWVVYNRVGDLVNSEVNGVIPANVRVSSGSMLIDSKFEDVTIGDSETAPALYHYTSGQVSMKGPSFLYGDVQVRAKIPGGTGLWPCIWMLGHLWQDSQPFTANTPGHNWPVGGWWELDIAEFMGNHRTQVNNALHFITANRSGSGEKSIPFDATTRFMVYRLLWEPTSLTWQVDAEDGVGWRTLTTMSGTAGVDIPNTPGYLVIHTAIGGAAVGSPDSSTFPQTMEVDYARVALSANSPDNAMAFITQDDQTSTATGTAYTAITGTSAQTQDAQTSTASGTHSVSGTSAQTQDDETSTTTAGFGPSGTSAQTQADQTSAATGAFGTDPVGSAACTQDDQTSTASGSSVTGDSAQTQADQTSTASGTFTLGTITGTGVVTQDDQVATASGWSLATGTVVVTQANQTSAGVGLIGLIADDKVAAKAYRERSRASTFRERSRAKPYKGR